MKKMVKLSFFLSLILSLGMMTQSCNTVKDSSKTNTSENIPNIEGTWVLKSLEGKPVVDLFKGATPTMTVDKTNNRVFGNGGCNTYTGKYDYSSGIFSTINVASTMMACLDENKEDLFLKTLNLNNKVSIENNTILKLTNGGKIVAEFVRGIDPSQLLGDWTLEAIANEDIKALFGEQVPTITFDITEKRLGGNSGCNRYNATYKLDGDKISVGPAMSTRMACERNMEGEAKFTQLITGDSELTTTGEKITFLRDGKTILSFVKSKK